ncbi:uncharacterized protein SPPG_02488 [Spizellomyces punctatus DAOM BR117]|uniref:A-kinase anchor protein 7-like phosphoesterase domain-containing protein n=1 Tax=Spizellomyces punctatus (strain DAOM BR117) TaxID=645134 RepID=A0A0L0HKI7_SPIPD|nr:uncharacterized protein SPPG_02488 [Spizellomyces punctatus DAOM BR117]KND01981.1 hypothetical protein SPPG_02488 [Spizellomyces punctatus DAOM BR117]|eukprot:XP_016610020.1 hypothetical protein SPPG_02488 [Spizellomyces punctatus DAOM BR117]
MHTEHEGSQGGLVHRPSLTGSSGTVRLRSVMTSTQGRAREVETGHAESQGEIAFGDKHVVRSFEIERHLSSEDANNHKNFEQNAVVTRTGLDGQVVSAHSHVSKRARTALEDADHGSIAEGKKVKERPNFFLSMRLNDPDIQGHFHHFYEHMHTQHPILKPCLIPPQQMHLTLLVMHLDDTTKDEAIKCFNSSREIVQNYFNGRRPSLHFRGTGSFGSRVVFATPEQNADLDMVREMAAALKQHFTDWGISLPGNKEAFVPHCTLMKIKDSRKLKFIPKEAWKEFKEVDWGSSIVANLELSSMIAKKDPDGYYKAIATLPFGK